jgi:hypothetical protein
MDLSSSLNEEGPIPNTSWDEFKRDVLGPPDDDKIIILSDFNEEEKVHEEDTTKAEVVPSSAARIPASTASTVDGDEAPSGVQDDNSGDRTPDQEVDGGSNGRDEAGSP